MPLQIFEIAEINVATPQSSLEFNSIPSGYTDLLIRFGARTSASGSRDDIQITVNGDTGSNYSARRLFGIDGSMSTQASTGAPSNLNIGSVSANGSTSNTFGSAELYVPNYTSSNNKIFYFDWTAENNSNAAYVLGITLILWNSSSAITSFKVESKAGNQFVANSTATLYGIL